MKQIDDAAGGDCIQVSDMLVSGCGSTNVWQFLYVNMCLGYVICHPLLIFRIL